VETKGERERGLVIVGGTIPLTSASRRSLSSSSRVPYFSRTLTDATGAAIVDATTTTTTTLAAAVAAAANYVFRVY